MANDFKGKNIGIKLMLFAEEIAKERGAKWLKVDTSSVNFRMKKLIDKLDYQKVGKMQLRPNKPIWYAYDKKL